MTASTELIEMPETAPLVDDPVSSAVLDPDVAAVPLATEPPHADSMNAATPDNESAQKRLKSALHGAEPCADGSRGAVLAVRELT
jgi:hypothetical protein